MIFRRIIIAAIGISLGLLGFSRPLIAQSPETSKELVAALNHEIVSPSVSLFQLRRYLLEHVAPLPHPANSEEWSQEQRRLREHLLNDVVFHGWPKEVIGSPPRFEERGVLETGQGYRIRKFCYEIIPGFYSAALLYEPTNIAPGSPAILNVNGHVGAPGKTVEYKQKRCIHFARHGILALNLEWLGFGELGQKENQHWYAAHLDLVGRHELGLFYLAMRRGLDFLAEHPMVDRARLGMTGLSGGGWQTILLSSLDERVKVAVPVAGFCSFKTRVEANWYGDLGDVEQSATDLIARQDYPSLVGLRAPRPTLLIYNAQDDCCFRAGLVKPMVFDAMQPIFRLFGAGENLEWHENFFPGTHNYQIDNRLQAYRFFAKHFELPPMENEGDLDSEIKTVEQLTVGLPTNNLSILGLARKLNQERLSTPIPASGEMRKRWQTEQRSRLRQLLRYRPVRLVRPWAVASDRSPESDAASYLFEMDDGLCANGVLARATRQGTNVPVTLILHDGGKTRSADLLAERLAQGETALAVDLLFIGDAWKKVSCSGYAQMIHGLGGRPLGLVVGQLVEIARWLRQQTGAAQVRLDTTGLRSETAALAAAALEPDLFSHLTIHQGSASLQTVLDKPVQFADAPELFCLDLLKFFDFDRMEALADQTEIEGLR